MSFNITLEVRGVDETIEFLDALPRMTQTQTLITFVNWGREMVQLGQKLSPKDKLRGIDPRRRPKDQSFAENWRYEVRHIGDFGAELRVGNVAEHMGFVIHDTPPRAIPRSVSGQLAKGYPMRFYWEGGWHSAWKIRGGVAASGTKGRPVHEWIIDEFDIGQRLRDITRR